MIEEYLVDLAIMITILIERQRLVDPTTLDVLLRESIIAIPLLDLPPAVEIEVSNAVESA